MVTTMEVSIVLWWKAANAAGLEQKLEGAELPSRRKVPVGKGHSLDADLQCAGEGHRDCARMRRLVSDVCSFILVIPLL